MGERRPDPQAGELWRSKVAAGGTWRVLAPCKNPRWWNLARTDATGSKSITVQRLFAGYVRIEEAPPDPRYSLCICPGCGWTGPKRPLEEDKDDESAAESFCTACGYEVQGEPSRLPSVAELRDGLAGGGWSQVDLGKFVPALIKALKHHG